MEGRSGQARRELGGVKAQLEHAGTFVILACQTLTRDQLATIAAGLKAAPDTDSI